MKIEFPAAPAQAIDFAYIGKYCSVLIGLVFVQLLVQLYSAIYDGGSAQRTVYALRKVSDKLNRLPLKYFDSRTHGEILSRVTTMSITLATRCNKA